MAGLGRKVFGSETLSSTEVQGYFMDQSVMVFASAAQRDGSIPSPSDGMVVYLTDIDRFLGRENGAWRSLRGDVTLGNAFLATEPGPVLAAAPAWTDLATVTATATGRAVTVDWSVQVWNDGSGADRTANVQVVVDTSTVVGSVSSFAVPLTGQPRIGRGQINTHTPAVGSRTWKLQANASNASSLRADIGKLRVVETG
jgi:hypothetical protein